MQFPSTRKTPNLSPGKCTILPRQNHATGWEFRVLSGAAKDTQSQERQRVPEFTTNSRTNPETTQDARTAYAFPYPYEIDCNQADSLTTRVLNPQPHTMPRPHRSTNNSTAAPAVGMVERRWGRVADDHGVPWRNRRRRAVSVAGVAPPPLGEAHAAHAPAAAELGGTETSALEILHRPATFSIGISSHAATVHPSRKKHQTRLLMGLRLNTAAGGLWRHA